MKKTCILFISLLCLVLIIGSAIFIYNQNSKNTEITTNQTPQSSTEPTTQNQVSEITETTETRDTIETEQETITTYSNPNFGLEFEIPTGWATESENLTPVGGLTIVIVSNENPESNITISTPPQEIGFGPAQISEGLSYDLDGYKQVTSNLYSFENGRLINKNIYGKITDITSDQIEVTLASDGNNFDKHLPTYYSVIDSLKFN